MTDQVCQIDGDDVAVVVLLLLEMNVSYYLMDLVPIDDRAVWYYSVVVSDFVNNDVFVQDQRMMNVVAVAIEKNDDYYIDVVVVSVIFSVVAVAAF